MQLRSILRTLDLASFFWTLVVGPGYHISNGLQHLEGTDAYSNHLGCRSFSHLVPLGTANLRNEASRLWLGWISHSLNRSREGPTSQRLPFVAWRSVLSFSLPLSSLRETRDVDGIGQRIYDPLSKHSLFVCEWQYSNAPCLDSWRTNASIRRAA